MLNTKLNVKPGFFRGLWQEQKQAVCGTAHRQFWKETVDGVKRVRGLKRAPTRVESFEAAVARLGLSQQDLADQSRRFKAAQIALYAFAGALLVYSLWMVLNISVPVGIVICISSGATAVNAYLQGFRAWQIDNRNLIRLEDAIRSFGTYFVL